MSGSTQCKGPVVGACLACSRSNRLVGQRRVSEIVGEEVWKYRGLSQTGPCRLFSEWTGSLWRLQNKLRSSTCYMSGIMVGVDDTQMKKTQLLP